MAVGDSRVTSYDIIDDKCDRRYALHQYDGIDTTLKWLS
jgi:hypothetical protein